MSNYIHPHSQAAMVGFVRKQIAAGIQLLAETGMSYPSIELKLGLVPDNGKTAMALVSKKHSKMKKAAAKLVAPPSALDPTAGSGAVKGLFIQTV